MRFTNFMKLVTDRAAEQMLASRLLSSSATGQWEPWMQIEMYVAALRHAGEKTSFTREQRFPGPDNKICDFQIISGGTTIWIELKVMLHDVPGNLVTRFLADVAKLDKIQLPIDTNTVGAIAWAPNNASQFVQDLKNKVGINNKYSYAIMRDGGVFFRGSLNTSQQIQGGDSVMAWYVEIG